MTSKSLQKFNRQTVNAPTEYPAQGIHHGVGAPKKLFGSFEQKGFISLLYSVDSEPLELWDKQIRNGRVKRVTDSEIHSPVLEITGQNIASTFITMPGDPYQSLGITLPVFNLVVKNLNLYFTFEILLVDDQNVRRRFKAANYFLTSRVRRFEAIVPLHLDENWNQISLNLQDWTQRAYGTTFVEAIRVQVHPNCRLRRVFFSDRENEYPTSANVPAKMEKNNKDGPGAGLEKKEEPGPIQGQVEEQQEIDIPISKVVGTEFTADNQTKDQSILAKSSTNNTQDQSQANFKDQYSQSIVKLKNKGTQADLTKKKRDPIKLEEDEVVEKNERTKSKQRVEKSTGNELASTNTTTHERNNENKSSVIKLRPQVRSSSRKIKILSKKVEETPRNGSQTKARSLPVHPRQI